MLVHVRCPTCEGLAQIDDKYLGAQVRCPRCKEPFPAQAAPSESMNAPAVLVARPEAPAPPRPAPGPAPTAAGKSKPEVAFDSEERMPPLSLERVPWARVDRIMPAQPVPFLLAVLAIAAGCWLVGFLLAPIKSGFLAAHEWQVQPFFLATHFLCLRLFVTCYTRNFLAGAARMDLAEGEAVRRVKQILGPTGGLIALLLALPLCVKDFLYLGSEDYIGTIDAQGALSGALAYGGTGHSPVDLFAWLIWCVEWFLNAYIWVVLVGFLVLTMWVLWKHHFRATIEVLLHEKQYRPFLLMSAQGATIVLLFAAVNGFYVWYAEGELTDYIGLGITVTLLLLGFGPPWMQLKSNVENAVNQETFRLQEKLVQDMRRRAEAGDNGKAVSTADLAERLDSALAILRTMYLERMHKELGRAEGKALLLLKLLAPAGSIGWKVIRPLVMGG